MSASPQIKGAIMNFLQDLFTPEMAITEKETVYPFGLPLIQERLAIKVAEDPDYEVFAPLVYFRHEAALLVPGAAVRVAPYKYFISNKGRVVSLRSPLKPKFIDTTLDSSGYPHFAVTIRKHAEVMTVHRAVACAFVAPSGDLKAHHPRDLIVVHKDNDKTNFNPNNLQWSLPPAKED